MKIGLASYECRDNDLAFNLAQMERAMRSAQGRAELLCFGESFLQGFNALCWEFNADKNIAVSCRSEVMERLCGMTLQFGVDLLFGYLEKDADAVYSSCAVIEKGNLIHNYRRISRGWKEYWKTDGHYREGTETREFLYHGLPIMPALCGDLWDSPKRFMTGSLLIWPVYVNFTLDEWNRYETEYAEQALLASRKTLMVNPISRDPPAHGGAFFFLDGKIQAKLGYDSEDILIVEI